MKQSLRNLQERQGLSSILHNSKGIRKENKRVLENMVVTNNSKFDETNIFRYDKSPYLQNTPPQRYFYKTKSHIAKKSNILIIIAMDMNTLSETNRIASEDVKFPNIAQSED